MSDEKKEVKDANKIYKLLSELIKKKNGQLLLDFYSYYFYDEIIKIERVRDKIFKLYWKNQDIKPHCEDVFPYYMYSLVKIDKIKIDKKIYIKANLLKKREVKEILNLNNNAKISSEPNNLFSQVEFFDKNNKLHSCIVSDMPFYSMCIGNKGSSFSKKELYYLNMEELISRFDKIDSKIDSMDEDNEDEIGEKGNSIRKILERVLKIYIIVKDYYTFEDNRNENDYDRLTLGNLMVLLKNKGDKISKFLREDMRILANKFSHDSGESYSLKDVKRFRDYSGSIIKNIIENIDSL